MKIKDFAKKIAAANRRKRELKRTEARELKQINKAYDLLCAQLEDTLLGTPWDDTESVYVLNGGDIYLNNLNPFNDFNLSWVNWCDNWNKTHITKANSNAFYERNIDNLKTNKNDRPIFITGDKLNHLPWAL